MDLFYWEILDEDYNLIASLDDTVEDSQDEEQTAKAQAKANELKQTIKLAKNNSDSIVDMFTLYPIK